MNKLIFTALLALGVSMSTTITMARQGADDSAGHIRQGRDADDPAGHQ